jgi:hypothetical protein
MDKLNLSRIRRQNQADLRKYERFGIQVFTEALRLQAVPNPSIVPMQEAYIKFYQTVFVDAATKEWDRIRVREKAFIPSDFFLNTWREWIKMWVLENLGFLITEVTETTRKKVQVILGEAIEQGLNPFQTQELLLQEIPDVKRARAIARTESTRANNEGKKRSARDWSNETGTQLFKLWVWGGSRDMREEHFALQNKPIREDQNFIGINGLPMDKPGDISGGAVNTVNCSCTVVYVSERYARRNYPDAFVGQPVRPAIRFVEPVFRGDQQAINTHKDFIIRTIQDLQIEREVIFNFSSVGNGRGSVGWEKYGPDKYRINNVVNIKTTGSNIQETIKHELRHVYQGEKMGFEIVEGKMFFSGEEIMTVKQYNQILKGTKSRSQSVFEKSVKKYINLPWEKDADDYAGVIRISKSLIVDEFYLTDLIDLPIEIEALLSMEEA